VRRTTLLVILVCAVSLTAHWAFMFWHQVHVRNLPEVLKWTDEARNRLAYQTLFLVMVTSIVGNFAAAAVARLIGYRRAIAVMCFGYFLAMLAAYWIPRGHVSLLYWLIGPGFFQGVFALFTMYLPPLFPTLLRTTGAGFCYNIGRIAAAAGTVFFGIFTKVGDYRQALLSAAFLFLPATLLGLLLPESPAERPVAATLAD
jgi:MFS family permease